MWKWSTKIALLYFLLILVLSFPLLTVFFAPRHLDFIIVELIAAIVAVLVLIGQFSLFSIQIKVEESRPVKKRGIIISAIICGLLITLLFFFTWLGLSTIFIGENLFPKWFMKAIRPFDDQFIWFFLGFWALLWGGWIIIFWKFYKKRKEKSYFYFLIKSLMAGSLLEMLVALPAHIISRSRGDCCAPAFNLIGLGTGLAIMFLVMGPGVLYLYKEKIKRKKREDS